MKTSPWDPVDRLKTDEARAAYREAAQELGDPDLLAAAEADIARAINKAETSLDENLTSAFG
jgi:DNA-binding phage protein